VVVLITGASSGIGRKLVLHYLNEGHRVAAVARREQKLTELYQEPLSKKGTLKIYPADVTDKEQMTEVIASAEQDLGSLDLVIANAGIITQHFTANLELEGFEQLMQTNVMGNFYTLIPAINSMMQRRDGQVVTISSLAGFYPIPRISAYCASKVALNYQLAGLYWLLKPYNVAVTTICPGFIKTEMTTSQQVPEFWCLEINQAVEKITYAITQKRRLYCFPLWQYQLLKMIGMLPHSMANFLIVLIGKLFPHPNSSNL